MNTYFITTLIGFSVFSFFIGYAINEFQRHYKRNNNCTAHFSIKDIMKIAEFNVWIRQENKKLKKELENQKKGVFNHSDNLS